MTTSPPQLLDAYDLLSKPTLELTDAEVIRVIDDLRQRRRAYLKTGKPDRPKAEKVKAEKLSKDEKARNTAAILSQLKIPGLTK